jgi:hypothetical protein
VNIKELQEKERKISGNKSDTEEITNEYQDEAMEMRENVSKNEEQFNIF